MFDFEQPSFPLVATPLTHESIDAELHAFSQALDDPQRKHEVLIEINQDQLNAYYILKPRSRLKILLANRGDARLVYTLAQLLDQLKEIILENNMFDAKNPAIILCCPELESVFNMKACHVSQVRELVQQHVLRLPQRYQDMLHFRASLLGEVRPIAAKKEADQKVAIISQDARFEIRPEFRQVLAHLPQFSVFKRQFTYDEITALLSSYILSRKESLFDARNIMVALVANDPLGKAFRVDSFHRCQVPALLQQQLIPVQDI